MLKRMVLDPSPGLVETKNKVIHYLTIGKSSVHVRAYKYSPDSKEQKAYATSLLDVLESHPNTFGKVVMRWNE